MGGSLIKNTGESLLSAASSGGEFVKRLETAVEVLSRQRGFVAARTGRSADDPELLAFFLELLRRVTEQLEAARIVQQLQEGAGPSEERQRDKPRRHDDEVKVARRQGIAPHARTEGDHLDGPEPRAQGRQLVADELR